MTAEQIERCQWPTLADDELVRANYSAATMLEDGIDVSLPAPASNAANAPS
jgi:hypothetical protein